MGECNFEYIKEKLSSSLRMKLDHIKRFLSQGNASVLVGAGFSKNAEMDASVCMKDWFALGIDFYTRLYGKYNREAGIDPIRLASQIDASFGRNELDEMILHSLPDDRVYPGELHKLLLKLQWKDVFTTNYDTLLERAMIDSGRHYEVVTNKETLLYKTSPRIIKLHGSFKDVRPFIMTEEDYRTYPFKHPEFVNTVRQSLIEGLLCLIGFSGNDPNFLEWVGWLRDVMGCHAAPVYLITFDKNLHSSEVKLNDSRGISTINLADIQCFDDSDIKDAFNFLFQYLEQNDTSNIWHAEFIDYRLDNAKNIDTTISQMAQIRQSYPGWIILPENYYHEFEDVSIKFPFLGHDISILKENKSQLISFLFELDWRLNISLSPKDVDWYIKSLSELIDEYVPENQSEKNKLESLWVSLLSIYRKQLDFDNFKKLQEKLNSLKNQFSNENIRRFYYECLLYNLSILDYEAVKKQLCEWRVLKSDYHGILCKANVYAEIGLENDAVSILNESLQNIRTQLLVNNISPLLTSCRILIEGNIRIYDYKRLGIIHKRKDQLSYDFFTIIRGLKRKIQDYTQSDSIYKTHEFNIGKTTRIWNLGPSGYDKSYLYSYRYIQAYEYVGFPIGLTDLTINNIDFRYVIPYYLKYNVYALLILIRLNNTNIVKKCVSRAVLKGISVEQACAFFDIYYPNILKYLNNKSNPVYVRTGSVLLPLFSRLSTRLTRDRIINFFKFYVKYYIDDRRFYNKDDLSIIYGCLANDDLHNIINLVYSQPINICGDDDVLFPQYDYNSYTINNDALGIIERGLRNRDINISNSAYRRLILIYKNLSGNDKEIIDKAIYEWRNTDELSINKKYSLRILPYNKHIDRFDIETIVKDEVLKFVTVKKILNFDSLPIQNLIHDIESLCSFNEYLSVSDYEKIIISITSFLKENKDVISKDDSDSIFGGMRNFTNQLYEKILRFIKNIKDWKAINNKIVDDLIAIFIDLGSYHLKYLSVVSFICPYSSKYKERSFIQKIEDSLFSGDYVMRADAINALIIMAENNISIQGLVKKIITCIELTQGESTSSYIELLIKLFLINKIGKDALKEIPKLLNSLFIGIQNNPVTDEYKTDIYYSSNKLAGVISVIISPLTTTAEMTKSIQLWKDFSNDKSTFNDVKIGFENGCLLVKHWK